MSEQIDLTTEGRDYNGNLQYIEVMGFDPDIHEDGPGLYVQFVAGCGYDVRTFTLDEAEQLIAALQKTVAEVKAAYPAPESLYEVIVGNVGTVYTGQDPVAAAAKFDAYVVDSKLGVGRAGNESVYLMEDGEPIREYQGPADDENSA